MASSLSAPVGFPEFPQSQSLVINDLVHVVEFLDKYGFTQKKWDGLGLRLGLHKNTLEAIELENRDNLYRCFTECLATWLRRADSVNLRGGATWDSLSDAVRAMNEIAVADMLDSEKCTHRYAMAINIFDSHCPNLLRDLIDPLDIASMLQKEGIITEEVLANLEKSADDKKCEVLLGDLRKVMNFSSLEKFIRVLQIKSNVTLANAIYHDYEEKILKGNSQVQWKTDPEVITPTMPSKGIPFPRYMETRFDTLQSSFNRMFSDVLKVATKMDDLSSEKIKSYLKDNYAQQLQNDLDKVHTMHDVIYLLRKECRLIDLSILEEIVEEFQILEAQIYIDSYKKLMEGLCKKISDICNEKFATSSYLQCETAVFLFDWKPKEHKIEDIKDLLSEATRKLVKIEYIEEIKSITVTCSFSYCLIESVKRELENKLSILIENGLMKLILGYEIIYEKPKTLKEEENRRRENKRGEIETENLRDKQPYMGYKPEYMIQIQKMNNRNKKMQNDNRYSKYRQQKDKKQNNTENEITEEGSGEIDLMLKIEYVTDKLNGNVQGIRFAIIIDNCGEVELEEDGTRILNKQAKCLHEVLKGSGFCVLYLNNLSSTAIDNLLRAFKNDADHSQLSMFFLIFLGKGKTPQLYDANNTVISFEDMFQYFHDDESSLSKVPKIFFFDVACLNESQPSLPDCPSNSLALATAHSDPSISFAVETLSKYINQKSIQDIFRMIQKRSCLKINKKTGSLAIDKSNNICLGDHLMLLRSLWYPIRTETVDLILKNKDEVMSIVRNERITRIAASAAGIVTGGGLVATGIVLAPFTFGASIGVSIAGGAVGALTSAGGIGAFIASKVLANKRLKYAQEHIIVDQQLSLTINKVVQMHEKEVHAKFLSQMAGVAATGGAMGIADAGRIAGRTNTISLAVTVPIDVAFIAYHSYKIHKANRDRTGRTDNNKVIQWLISQAEEMLKGMCLTIDVIQHEIAGGQITFYERIEYGYSIYIPVAPVKSSSVTVRTIFSGPITLPEGYTLVSAMYDITLPELQEAATIAIEHCVDETDVSIVERLLCFATATFDIEKKILHFSPVDDGVFKPGETFGSIKRNESCFLCILKKSVQDVSMKYAARVMQLNSHWNHKVIFSKDLQAHFKYSQKSLSIRCDHYKFHFASVAGSDVLAIRLNNCRESLIANGWTIIPDEIPQIITKREIDTLELQPKVWKLQNEIFPTICFYTGYDENDYSEELYHQLLIDGIVPNQPIVLKCQRLINKNEEPLLTDNTKVTEEITPHPLPKMPDPSLINKLFVILLVVVIAFVINYFCF